MTDLSPLSLSAILLLSGLLGYVLVNQLIGYASQRVGKQVAHDHIKAHLHLPKHDEAYFLVAPGGVITFSNSSIRKLLGLNGSKPNLEMIASEIQPSESLFALCSQEGKARFNIGDRLFEGRSYTIPHESSQAMLISLRRLDIGRKDISIKHPAKPALIERTAVEIDNESDRKGSNGLRKNTLPIQENSWLQRQELEKRVLERTSQLRREHERTEALLRITTELSTSLDYDCILQRTLEVLKEVISASHATCMVLQGGNKKLRHVATVGYENPLPPGGMPSALNINQGLVGWIITNRQPVLIDDVLKDDRWMQLPNSWYSHRSAIGAPIVIGEQLLGVLLLYYPEVGRFSAEQLDLIKAAANQMAVAIKNAELYHLTRDQKEDLSTLLREQRIETSRSRSILEAIADGVLVTDQHGEISLFNHSAERMLDLKRAEVIGRSIEHFSGLFGGIALAWIDTIKDWMEDPTTFNPLNTFSEQVSLDNGKVLSVNLAPVINNKEFFGTVSVFRDITHLIEVDRLKSEFVATVSHELRTPMTSIKGYVDILLMGVAGELSDQQLRFLRVVQQNTERLTILVNDLLDLSRIEAGHVNLTLGSIYLPDLIKDVMEEIDRLRVADNKLMEFKLDLPSDLSHIKGDSERIRQILINLLGNAFHYTPANGIVELSARRIGEEVRVDIKDNGVGIPPKEQERIFDRFYRGENHMVIATAGTGLGLSIVAKLINMHHGRIWVQSSGIEGEGSTFSFTLPVFKTSPEMMKARQRDA